MGSQKQDEGNERLVGREEVEERVRGMEVETGKESKPNSSRSLLEVCFVWKRHGLQFRSQCQL